MLRWAVILAILALVAGVLGFGGLAGDFAYIAKILLFVFLVLFVVSLVLGRGRGGPVLERRVGLDRLARIETGGAGRMRREPNTEDALVVPSEETSRRVQESQPMQVADKVASKLTAADVMSPAPRTCSIYSSVLEAVLIFRDADCGAIPVVETGEAVGILTDRDAVRALAEHPDLATREVGDIMTRGVVSVAPGDSLASVAAKFGARGLHRLLVVDSGKMLRGIVAWSDLAPHLSDRAVDRFVSEVIRQPRESGLA